MLHGIECPEYRRIKNSIRTATLDGLGPPGGTVVVTDTGHEVYGEGGRGWNKAGG